LSFKSAADELLLTPSAVSHGIQSLEEWLGAELFIRSPRGLTLTDTGGEYYPVVRDALWAITSGTNRITGRRDRKRLFISAAPTFAARWLLPRLYRFRERAPDISIMLDSNFEIVGLDNTDVDLAIRKGEGDWQGVQADKLVTEELVPVCAPSIADRARDLTDIEKAPLIHVTTIRDDWAFWAMAAKRPIPNPDHGLCFDMVQMAFDAAVQGLGVAIGRKPLVDAELRSNKLVEVWQPSIMSNTSYWLVMSPARVNEPAIAAFRNWLAEEAKHGPDQG
jgi:DNA-binding transcriptional LysR family regulator